MRTSTHNLIILAGIAATGAFGGGLIAAGTSRIEEFRVLLLFVPILWLVAFALYLDVSRSVYVAEAYIHLVAHDAFAELNAAGTPKAWYWEQFASAQRGSWYMSLVAGIKLIAGFVVPTLGALGAFIYLAWPSPEWYEWFLLSFDALAIAVATVAQYFVHHEGRPIAMASQQP